MLTRLLASCLILLGVPNVAETSNIQRCEGAGAQITFTYQGCPTGENVTSLPRNGAAPAVKTPTPLLPGKPSPSSRPTPIVVVGERDDGCGNRLSAENRRRAIINKRTPPGMTRRDVESLLGRPDKIIGKNGETRLVYNAKKGRSNQVTLDRHGCVKGKR
jgi:hypothetical protein